MEDFYMYEDPFSGTSDGSGIIEIGGKSVKFSYSAYGACYTINVDGSEYPEICGGGDDWTYRFAGTAARAGDKVEQVSVPPNDPSFLVVKRLDEICHTAPEPYEDPTITQIATNVEAPEDSLEDIDEFDERGDRVALIHVKNGRVIEMPDSSRWSEFIEELPVLKQIPEPPLPKNLYRGRPPQL